MGVWKEFRKKFGDVGVWVGVGGSPPELKLQIGKNVSRTENLGGDAESILPVDWLFKTHSNARLSGQVILVESIEWQHSTYGVSM